MDILRQLEMTLNYFYRSGKLATSNAKFRLYSFLYVVALLHK